MNFNEKSLRKHKIIENCNLFKNMKFFTFLKIEMFIFTLIFLHSISLKLSHCTKIIYF